MSSAPGTPPAPLFAADVRAGQLPALLEAYAPHARVLSLDCFDTLLWRDTVQPIDVFFDLQNEPIFQRLGLSAQRRIDAESEARRYAFVRDGLNEVTLEQIYSPESLRLEVTPAERAELIEAELRAEERACAPFLPVLELLRAAKTKGMEVIVVSDTYLSEAHLRRLLGRALPAGAMGMLDGVFCSCEHGRSKSNGLFQLLLPKLKRRPSEILHVGDNPSADFFAPRAAGLHAAHLLHHDGVTEQILRMQTIAYSLQHAPARHSESIPSPFRALLASVERPDSPEGALGYASLGPLLYSFAKYVLGELEALAQAGKRVKPLFLMRDGYLPQQVCNALAGREVGAPISLSRFASRAAAFRKRADVEEYLSRIAEAASHFEPLAKQLLLPAELANKIIARAQQARRPAVEFNRQILGDKILRIIFERSKAYRARLYKHLDARAKLERGDTLVFIDLGYAGTGQRMLGPLLKDDWDIDVLGRYLLATPTPGWQRDRSGLIDASSCDNREIFSLIPNVCVLEDLCTVNLASAIDFDAQGEPLGGNNVIASAQFDRLKPIQAACLEFARDAQGYFDKLGKHPTTRALKATGLGALTRLLFFPGEKEIACLEGFQFDLNLATDDSFRLFNRAQGLLGLQRRGLPAMEQHEEFRTNYPIELRATHLSLALTQLTADRHSLTFNRNDLTLRRETVPVIFLRGSENATIPTDAMATYDGYYSLIVPFGDGSFKTGILFGKGYRWLQIESIQAIPNQHLFSKFEAKYATDLRGSIKLEQMVERAPGLFECTSPNAFLLPLLPPKAAATPGKPPTPAPQLACRIVYRPVALRPKPGA